jgi:selenide,water dikinase
MRVLDRLEPESHPDLLVGSEGFADAGVYRLDEKTALVQTVDFFTPVVDDPWTYGAIAAANSLSDVYAMGGRPLTALVIACTPPGFDLEALAAVFAGGQEKAHEAGVVLLGGHTVKAPELKYGLAVTGVVHPDRIVTNAGARPGDVLYLTKPVGTGVITTALKEEDCPPGILQGAVEVMLTLNRAAAEAMVAAGASAATDVTGFGLLGHAHQLAHTSGVRLAIDPDAVPVQPGAIEAIAGRHIPGGLNANRDFVKPWLTVESAGERPPELLYDPQTSGGLLIAIPAERAQRLAEELATREVGVHPIGRVEEGRPGHIVLRS